MIAQTISFLSKANLETIKSESVSKPKNVIENFPIIKATTQEFELNLISLNLHKLCLDAIQEIETTINLEVPIEFTFIGQNNNVNLDAKLIYPILLNLLVNAVKYSQKLKNKINLKATVAANSVTFTVEDRGIGIPAGDQAYVFKSFYRGQNTDEIIGSGIGLTIVKRCVDLHQGQISFESTLGKGSKFTVCIPLTINNVMIN
ncbi:two-component hybrid sensor and regulator [Stanieria sp. NIES-3757]|nr:two-component hybrid sensor and regulator [Stanieria sp. NIES-3757]